MYEENEAMAVLRMIMEDVFNVSSALEMEGYVFSESELLTLRSLSKRLLQGEPIQYLTGKTFFAGLWLKCAPGALIPRPETEELVELAVGFIRKIDSDAPLKIIDACSGSGCIALGVKHQLPNHHVLGLEWSNDALAISRDNAAFTKLNVSFELCDVLANTALPPCDVLLSNPPYVLPSEAEQMEQNVMDYEPHQALFVPETDALVFYKALITKGVSAGVRLMMFEINPLKSTELLAFVKSFDTYDAACKKDIFGKERFLILTANE